MKILMLKVEKFSPFHDVMLRIFCRIFNTLPWNFGQFVAKNQSIFIMCYSYFYVDKISIL